MITVLMITIFIIIFPFLLLSDIPTPNDEIYRQEKNISLFAYFCQQALLSSSVVLWVLTILWLT